jgi:hypothetical protein
MDSCDFPSDRYTKLVRRRSGRRGQTSSPSEARFPYFSRVKVPTDLRSAVPGIGNGVVGRSIEKQSRQVEYRDRRSGDQEEIDETAPLRIAPSRRHGSLQQGEPEDEANGEQYLPEAADLEVFQPWGEWRRVARWVRKGSVHYERHALTSRGPVMAKTSRWRPDQTDISVPVTASQADMSWAK